MQYRKQTVALIIVLVLIVGWITFDFLSNGESDFKGGFKEVATYRNENNTGPVQLVYIVTIKDPAIAELEAYGNSKPHHKYGNTKVYYFLENTEVPTKLSPGIVNFDEKYNASCLALYEKGAMGNYGLTKHPFR